MKKKYSIIITASLGLFLLSFTPKIAFQTEWKVPDVEKSKANPLKGDAASVATGKALYATHCKSCHGTKGKGDGPKASQLDTECGDFTKAAFQAQTDGALFYKTKTGRKDMPSFKTKIADANDMWAVVNYLRTLK